MSKLAKKINKLAEKIKMADINFIVGCNHNQVEEASLRKHNSNLLLRYPFLRVGSDDYSTQCTMLDFMPDGWRIAFGIELCEEIRKELKRFDKKNGTDTFNEYRFVEIKEKFGELRIYGFGFKILCEEKEVPLHASNRRSFYEAFPDYFFVKYLYDDEDNSYYIGKKIIDKCNVDKIIDKFSKSSTHVCIKCGKESKFHSTGWISPYCEECKKSVRDRFIPDEEWFK